MQIVFEAGGIGRCIYGETINLSALGSLEIQRASHVEPTSDGQWVADLSPEGGPRLGPFLLRSTALAAERQWLEAHWLTTQPS